MDTPPPMRPRSPAAAQQSANPNTLPPKSCAATIVVGALDATNGARRSAGSAALGNGGARERGAAPGRVRQGGAGVCGAARLPPAGDISYACRLLTAALSPPSGPGSIAATAFPPCHCSHRQWQRPDLCARQQRRERAPPTSHHCS